MKYDYFDPTCPTCGKKNVQWKAYVHYYNLISCLDCYSNFRASAPEGEISILADSCAKCGAKPIQYSRSLTLEPLSYDIFYCVLCGTYTQSDPYGNVWSLEQAPQGGHFRFGGMSDESK
ncbi:MAG: hypothetical protein ACFFED_07340 [Candidatus Thorarchaeota archaeon]